MHRHTAAVRGEFGLQQVFGRLADVAKYAALSIEPDELAQAARRGGAIHDRTRARRRDRGIQHRAVDEYTLRDRKRIAADVERSTVERLCEQDALSRKQQVARRREYRRGIRVEHATPVPALKIGNVHTATARD